MPTTYPNLDLTVPDIGTTPWYASLLDWLAKIDAFAGGYWAPLTDGDPDDPQLIFAEGQVVMAWVDL